VTNNGRVVRLAMRVRTLILASILPLTISFAASAADGLYSIWECLENHTCHVRPAAYQSVRDIDFRNFAIHLEMEVKEIRLTNGHYEDSDQRADLKDVRYLPPLNAAGAEFVLLVLSRQRKAANPGDEWIAQVLEFSKQQSFVIQEFSVDLHNAAHSTFAHAFDEARKTLLMRFDGQPDAHACGSATDRCTVTYKWSGSRFRYLPLTQN
jgi:hypothetical protein